ncbi:hypothetical protein C7212DRAFT_352930 [Tuber magnatum]|uniref:Uncharacterized protein n=1 Tax=Tuber magnatum TaxID=42249 RepID=A0A317SPC6_9PEZI|nr:hypothetical protein C7212DRAFT_352930 [Tuber magnatum]
MEPHRPFSPIETAFLCHEPIASSILGYLAVHEVIILASTCHPLRAFLFSHSGYWHETNLCPCPPELALNPRIMRWDGPTERLGNWRHKLLPFYRAPYNWPDDYELLTIFLRTLFVRNLMPTVQIAKLVFDGLPIKRDIFFEITDRLWACLRVLSVRGCTELEISDFIKLLDFPEPAHRSHFPPHLKKLSCFGTVVYDEPYEIRTMSLSHHTRKSLQLSLSHFRSLLAARSLECDIGPCEECEDKRLGLRGGDVCANCGVADNTVRCVSCEKAENSRRRCASCRRGFCSLCRDKIMEVPLPDDAACCKECFECVSSFPGCVKCNRVMIPSTSYPLDKDHGITGSLQDVCGLCHKWMCTECIKSEYPNEDIKRWTIRQCTNCFNSICKDCGIKYSEEDYEKALNLPAVREAISLRTFYQEAIEALALTPAPDATVSVAGGKSYNISSESAKVMAHDRFQQVGPPAIHNLVVQRADTWKPLMPPCDECEQWWCWECRLRCTCPEAETDELPNGDAESSNSADKTPETVGWSEMDSENLDGMDEDSDEESVGQRQYLCLVHNKALDNIHPDSKGFCWSCGLWPREYTDEDQDQQHTNYATSAAASPVTDGSANPGEDEDMNSSDDWEWYSHRSHASVAS